MGHASSLPSLQYIWSICYFNVKNEANIILKDLKWTWSSHLLFGLLTSIRTKIDVILSVPIVSLNTSFVPFMSLALEKHYWITCCHIWEAYTTLFYFSSCSKTIQTWYLAITGDGVELSKKLAEFSGHKDGTNCYFNLLPFLSNLQNVFDDRIRPYRVHNVQQVGFLRDPTSRKVRHMH